MASLLPNGKQQFVDSNGEPLAGGSVTFYIPSTTTQKDTWQDSGQTILNTNPVILDSLGSAIIYGAGLYRQIVRDADNNIIWDQLTADVAAAVSSGQWAGTSGGTANAQTVVAPNFSSSDGQTIVFRAGFSNTGGMTLNPSGAGPITVLKDTSLGPIPVSAGDIVAGNVIQVVYVTADGSFHATSGSSSSSVVTGMISDFAGPVAPAGWLLCAGQAVNRTTYASLFNVIGIQYGAGDGSTTFNVPDLRGRVTAGLDNMGGGSVGRLGNALSSTILGAVGGLDYHYITLAELPVFVPSGVVTVANWSDYYNAPVTSLLGNVPPYASIAYTNALTSLVNGTTATFAGNAIGGGSYMAWVQPTMVVNKIIKI